MGWRSARALKDVSAVGAAVEMECHMRCFKESTRLTSFSSDSDASSGSDVGAGWKKTIKAKKLLKSKTERSFPSQRQHAHEGSIRVLRKYLVFF